MIILSGTSDILRLVTTAATALDVHCSYVDNTTTVYTPGRQNTAIAAIATTTVLAAPASASVQRQLKKMTACARGGANTVTVEYFDGATAFRALSVALAIGEILEYEDLAGWMIRDGTGALKTTGVGTGRLIRAPQVITAGVTYAPPAGCSAVLVECQAGGGGGGGTTSVAISAAAGGGGAAGALARRYYPSPPASCTIAIGAAGGAGAATGATGGVGGNTTFSDGTTVLTANGGPGGVGQVGAATVGGALGGAAATTTNSDGAYTSQPGFSSMRQSGTQAHSGAGGSSHFGGGGLAPVAQNPGNAATGFGGGGSGGLTLNGGVAVAGGAGTIGVIRIWEFT